MRVYTRYMYYIHACTAPDKLMLSRSYLKSTDAGDLLYKTVHLHP